jgi:hypothetical protein
MQSRSDLLNAIRKLPPQAAFLQKSYKDMWLRWLSGYDDPAHARANPNRSAEFIYNALNHPQMIIWLAAASGISNEKIQGAIQTVNQKDNRMAQAASLRRLLPWSLVSEHLTTIANRPRKVDAVAYDDVVADLDDIYRSPAKQTTKHALIAARLGQGQFRVRVAERWNNQCAVTGCSIVSVLRASHIKPWSKSSNKERLNPANGLLLIAHIDALFDCGCISFADDGRMILSASVGEELKRLQLPDRLRREPTKAEKQFLAYHRRHVFAA